MIDYFTIKCGACGGSGGKPFDTGGVDPQNNPIFDWEPCPTCKGSGNWHPIILKRECGECSEYGRGYRKSPCNCTYTAGELGFQCNKIHLEDCTCNNGVIERPVTNEEVFEMVSKCRFNNFYSGNKSWRVEVKQ